MCIIPVGPGDFFWGCPLTLHRHMQYRQVSWKAASLPFPQSQKEKWKIVQKSMERSSLKGKIKNKKRKITSDFTLLFTDITQ